jgi:hypothetical protein
LVNFIGAHFWSVSFIVPDFRLVNFIGHISDWSILLTLASDWSVLLTLQSDWSISGYLKLIRHYVLLDAWFLEVLSTFRINVFLTFDPWTRKLVFLWPRKDTVVRYLNLPSTWKSRFRCFYEKCFFDLWPCHTQTNYFFSYDPPYSWGNMKYI